jgi:hypothetical protein
VQRRETPERSKAPESKRLRPGLIILGAKRSTADRRGHIAEALVKGREVFQESARAGKDLETGSFLMRSEKRSEGRSPKV